MVETLTFQKKSREFVDAFLSEHFFNFIEDPGLRNFAEVVWNDYGSAFMCQPAARSHHHNYECGLLDHSFEVFSLAKNAASVFPNKEELALDELYVGAFFHDIGKVCCYDFVGDEIHKTDDDKMVGHFGIGLQILEEYYAGNRANIYTDQQELINHILVSHHGDPSNGWGSLVAPCRPEAYIVHLVDMISSRVGGDKPNL